jgi:hypothetical protein
LASWRPRSDTTWKKSLPFRGFVWIRWQKQNRRYPEMSGAHDTVYYTPSERRSVPLILLLDQIPRLAIQTPVDSFSLRAKCEVLKAWTVIRIATIADTNRQSLYRPTRIPANLEPPHTNVNDGSATLNRAPAAIRRPSFWTLDQWNTCRLPGQH